MCELHVLYLFLFYNCNGIHFLFKVFASSFCKEKGRVENELSECVSSLKVGVGGCKAGVSRRPRGGEAITVTIQTNTAPFCFLLCSRWHMYSNTKNKHSNKPFLMASSNKRYFRKCFTRSTFLTRPPFRFI